MQTAALNRPIVCYVTDGRDFPSQRREDLALERIRAAISAEVDWIQIREKDLAARRLLILASEAIQLAASHGASARILINNRFDVAIISGAAGAHFGADSIPIELAVRWLRSARGIRSDFWVGASCHGMEDLQSAEASGANYVFFGPVFDTPSKRRFGKPQGLGRLAEVCRAAKVPVIAIGGINEENGEECLRAGAAGIAAIRLFQEPHDPAEIQALVSRWHGLQLTK